MRRHLRWWVLVPAAIALAVGVLGIGVRSTNGGNAAVDEPQYLLTAISLWEDHDLDISDELAAQRWRVFHQATLPVQTEPLAGGRAVSPHDPLLPLLLAAPVGLFGWVGAKVAMAALAAAAAGLLSWTAVRRFGLPPVTGAAAASVAFATPPLGVYANQVYPEVPAALAVLAAVAALAAPRIGRRHLLVAGLAVVVLPWLGLKYLLVASAVAFGGYLVARDRSPARTLATVGVWLVLAGAGWLGAHRLLYGGWTSFATGVAFQGGGEFSVVGDHPDYAGRSVRVVGLLVDDHFGIGVWQPAYLLLPAALAVVLWRLRADRRVPWLLVSPLLAGWVTATWVALTMHGFWWPGRQLVVVLPLGVLTILLATRVVAQRYPHAAWGTLAALGIAGVFTMAGLLLAGQAGTLTWVYAYDRVPSPVYALLRLITPDYRGTDFWVGHVSWAVVLAASAVLAVRLTSPAPAPPRTTHPSPRGTLV